MDHITHRRDAPDSRDAAKKSRPGDRQVSRLMNNTRSAFKRRYLTTLRTHLGNSRNGNHEQARELGRALLNGGKAALDLAVVHEQAVLTLAPSHDFANTRNGVLKRAGVFFT